MRIPFFYIKLAKKKKKTTKTPNPLPPPPQKKIPNKPNKQTNKKL